MRVSRTGAWTAATVVVCVLLLVAAWFLVVDPQRAQAQESRAQTADTAQSNAELRSRIDDLQVQYAALDGSVAELTALRAALPGTPALSQFLAELSASAETTGVVLDSVTTGTASPATAAAGGVAVPSPSPAPASSPPALPAASPTDAPTVTPTAAVVAPAEGATGGGTSVSEGTTDGTGDSTGDGTGDSTVADDGTVLAAVPVTVTVTGGYDEVAGFIRAVQNDLVRAFLVDDCSVSADRAEASGESESLKAVLTGRVFVLVDPGTDDLQRFDLATAGATAAGVATAATTAPGEGS